MHVICKFMNESMLHRSHAFAWNVLLRMVIQNIQKTTPHDKQLMPNFHILYVMYASVYLQKLIVVCGVMIPR